MVTCLREYEGSRTERAYRRSARVTRVVATQGQYNRAIFNMHYVLLRACLFASIRADNKLIHGHLS